MARIDQVHQERRSLAQFTRFATFDKQSYQKILDHLGTAAVPIKEEGWIPYCIPCIVRSLTGDNVR